MKRTLILIAFFAAAFPAAAQRDLGIGNVDADRLTVYKLRTKALAGVGNRRAGINSGGEIIVDTATYVLWKQFTDSLTAVRSSITSSSSGGVTINNNTSGYLLTASGTAGTINGNAAFQFSGNTAGANITLYNSSSSGFAGFQANKTNGTTFGAFIGYSNSDNHLRFNTNDGAISFRTAGTERIGLSSAGAIILNNVPTHADNAAATAAGLVAGTVYRTSTGVLMIRY